MIRLLRCLVWVGLGAMLAGPAAGAELLPPPEGLEARAVAERVEDIFRGETSYLEATMIIHSARLPAPRRVTFRSWDDRPGERAFIRILAPPKDKGMGFLKLVPNLWNYIPRVERTIRIPPSMMLQSWMGSDFTNDDLVRDSSQLDDYDHVWLGVDPEFPGAQDGRAYGIAYVPHEDAPVVWGRIESWIDAERLAPLRQEFFDEGGAKLRRMDFGEIRDVQGRPYPHHWKMVPLDKEGHATEIEVEEIRFDESFDDAIFTKRNLTRTD